MINSHLVATIIVKASYSLEKSKIDIVLIAANHIMYENGDSFNNLLSQIINLPPNSERLSIIIDH